MKTVLLAILLCAASERLFAAAPDPLAEEAKKSQEAGTVVSREAAERADLREERTKDLGSILGKIVDGLEARGVAFESVQGDSRLNPLPELFKGKVGLEWHDGFPRAILKPKGRDRVYASIDFPPEGKSWTYAVRLGFDRVAGKDLRSREGLEALAPKLRRALLKAVAGRR